MRNIPVTSVTAFVGVNIATTAIALAGAAGLTRYFGLHWASVPPFLLGIALYYAGNLLALKLILFLFPIPVGTIAAGTQADTIVGIYLLFYIFHIAPLNFSRLLPAPFTSLWYRFLGAQIGRRSYPSGSVLSDPHFIRLGDDVTLGFNSVLTPHVMVGDYLSHERIVVGDRVTIGVNTVVYGNTEIGDGSLVLANSTVVPGTRIGVNEMWGGNPAKHVKKIGPGDIAWQPRPQSSSVRESLNPGLLVSRKRDA